MNQTKITLLLILSVLLFTQCEVINPEEEIPAYIDIPEIVVNEDFSQISDAWVYVDDNLVGVYALPAHFPVYSIGERKITIRPGIKNNGIAVTRGYYPFYAPYVIDTVLTPKETLTITPTTQYREYLEFPLEETFESVALTLEISDTTSLGFVRTDTVADAPSGKVAYVDLLPDTVFSVQTIEQFQLPGNRSVYLELSYKTNYYFELAWKVENLMDNTIRTNPIYQFNPNTEWQHIYIYLTDFITDYDIQTNRFRFLLGSRNSASESKYIYFDNIRLIYFQ
ncbi:MAG: hypothetical protein PF489_12595 [Salinivirgaceae bacterium]|jgi:hypothetical protein|nr:hypothetical protein [Salinivirgaceae bacterium]